MIWGKDGFMYVGEMNWGWGSVGDCIVGLEWLIWNGKMLFEMKIVWVKFDGFEIEFIGKVDFEFVKDLDNFSGCSYVYKYYFVYGSLMIKLDSL